MYTKDEVLKSTLDYFQGDELAATTWINKYCLKDREGNYLELNPDDMHHRLAKEFARIESNYSNPLSEDEIYNLMKNFRYVIPQGSPMSGIGNSYKISSLSNCFVIGGHKGDSIGGILKLDEELAQISKRRGGVGIDLSFLRPEGSVVTNDAVTSSGLVSFAERYSNTTREIGQGGRRGALMLSVSIKHPDAEKFIDAKLDLTKITGANISIRITDEFMDAVNKNKRYLQVFPCDYKIPDINIEDLELNKLYKGDNYYYRAIDAPKLWDKIIFNAHKSAEPGVLFWDTIIKESPADCYKDYGYETKGTNPCFTGDTLVTRMLPGGNTAEQVPIANIMVGDKVLSYNTKKDKLEFKKVKSSGLTRRNADIVEVEIGDGDDKFTVRCTPDHRFYNPEKKVYETPYEGMVVDISTTKLSAAHLRSHKLSKITCVTYAGTADVYDIGVFGNHTFYAGEGQVLVHNCSELPLSPYDSCRLISMNLYSYVDNPFTKSATFNFDLFQDHVIKAQKLMDDLVDLEIEKVHAIIDKVKSDPEDEELKHTELTLWHKILKATSTARRTGLGVTAVGDMIAALGYTYGSDECISFTEKVFKSFAVSSYASSINMAKDRGAFSIFNYELEKDNPFLNRITSNFSKSLLAEYKKYGRRNIANLTLAPTGTTSMMTQTTSGVEPVFTIKYKRRRKITDNSKQSGSFKDRNGDEFEEFNVWHPRFLDYVLINYGTTENLSNRSEVIEYLDSLSEEQFNTIVKNSPYNNSTAQYINWVNKVKLQGRIQKYIDHAISATTNIPKDTSLSVVSEIYKTAYEVGCKGHTIYRDGSRDGILITEDNTITNNYKRPEDLECKIVRFRNGNENWIAFVGLVKGKPYELFTGKVDDDLKFLPKSIESGIIRQVRDAKEMGHRYDFIYDIKFGYKNALPDIGNCFNPEYWNYAIMVSEMLRSKIKLDKIITLLENLSSKENSMNVWNRGVARALKKFVADGTESESACPECGAKMIYENGCKHCIQCGYSACS